MGLQSPNLFQKLRGGVSIQYFNKLILAKINEKVSKFKKIKHLIQNIIVCCTVCATKALSHLVAINLLQSFAQLVLKKILGHRDVIRALEDDRKLCEDKRHDKAKVEEGGEEGL